MSRGPSGASAVEDMDDTLLEAQSEPASTEPDRSSAAPAAAQPSPAPASRIEIDESHLVAGYANFCRVSSTPEELILDLGLNPQPLNPENTKVQVSQRIILNHFTAKRLFNALGAAIQRHEQAFGVLETDVRRRLR